MLYHLLTPLSNEATFFNVFRYISFRVAWGMVTALSLCYVLFPPFIRWMRQQRMEQIIRAEGPQSHLETKVGTPTMGGIPMLTAIVVSTLLWARLDNAPIWMALTILVAYGAIGFVDDWKKVMQRSSDGLSPRWNRDSLPRDCNGSARLRAIPSVSRSGCSSAVSGFVISWRSRAR